MARPGPPAARPRSRPQPAEHASLQVGVFRSGDVTSQDCQSSDLYEIAAEPAFTGTLTLPDVLLKSLPVPARPAALSPAAHHLMGRRPALSGRCRCRAVMARQMLAQQVIRGN